MTYTNSQKNLISALIGTKITPRTKSASLRQSLMLVNEHLYSGELTVSDLILLNSALELLVPDAPEDENKEEYRELIEALMVTRGILREKEEADDAAEG